LRAPNPQHRLARDGVALPQAGHCHEQGDTGVGIAEDFEAAEADSEAFVESADDLRSVDPKVVSDIVLFTTDWTVETIINQIDKGNIVLDPKWQRRDAWDLRKKSDLIESIMLNFPVPPIVLAELVGERGKYLVIDGKQRLLTLRQFYAKKDDKRYNQFNVAKVQILSSIRGKNYEKMSNDIELRDMLSGFENYPIRTIIVRNWKDENILYGIFLRLNSGSQKLYPQELRQALHPGMFIDFIDERAAGSPAMRAIFRRDGPDFRMRDNELLIRYIGFKLMGNDYRGNLKEFLDSVVRQLNVRWNASRAQVETDLDELEEAHRFCTEVFGAHNAYRKWNGDAYERQFNRAVFDVMAFAFSSGRIRRELDQRKPEIEASFKQACTDDVFRRSIEVTTKSTEATFERFSYWARTINRLMGAEVLRVPVPAPPPPQPAANTPAAEA
jgi:hypothetical protein